ncbi:MAG: carbohydrate ABC transporter permease [Tabrizicola sp.]|uniref:carbohydrate ABC transporter permease n=1 Tax=Tabrizicola sp. TaxID=2005166 RepID=UPI002ABBAACA|nr:carbohydrate ABC transporter permease [Tabrizicola sp.]MDZ4085441.1 carbohydrate ABC transporter permease [Tabrizicola sp.]
MADRTPARGWLQHLILLPVALVTLFPLFWMVTTAFTPNELVLTRAIRFWPEQPTLDNFRTAFARHPVGLWLLNGFVVSAFVTLGKLLISLPAAYAFARMEFRGRDTLFWLVVATLTFPSIIGIVPTFIGVVKLGYYDTLAGVIVPSIAFVGFYIFYLRQNFRQLPSEMFEAALLDNAGPWRQFVQIALPNMRAPIAAVTVLSFLGAWNIYFWSLLILESPEKKTITIGIKVFTDIEASNQLWGPMMAVALLGILPVLVLFALAQRQMIEAFAPGSGGK